VKRRLYGLDMATRPPGAALEIINDLIDRSGVRNVANGVMLVDDRPDLDYIEVTAAFDPWYWTGRRD